MKRTIVPFLLVLLCAPQLAMAQESCVPQGTAVLIDVSGSMRFDVDDWPTEVKRTVRSFIVGASLDESVWKVDGVTNDAFIENIRNGVPLYDTGQALLVAHVGEIDRTYPFLRTIEMAFPTSFDEASSFLDSNFPNAFNDQWTFLGVSFPVVRDRMLDQGARCWYVLLISDDDQDLSNQSRAPEEAKSLDNAYGTKVDHEKLLALAYRRDTNLRMNVFRVTSMIDPCASSASLPLCSVPDDVSPAPRGRIQLRTPARDEVLADGRATFRWSATERMKGYTFHLRDEDGETVAKKRVSKDVYTVDEPLDSGTYTWAVTGQGDTGPVTSTPTPFRVAGSLPWSGILWILLIIGVGSGVAMAYRSYARKNQPPEI